MWSVRNENSLTHYGVKGMRWGVRKEYESKGRSKTNTFKENKVLSFENDFSKTTVTIQGSNTIDGYKKQLKDFKLMDPERTNFYMPEAIASTKFKNLPKIENTSSTDRDILKVNPGRDSDKRRNQNCFQCTIAYEMRQRGYDVYSNTNHGGHNFEYLHAFDIKDSFRVTTKGNSASANYSDAKSAEECFNRISAQCLEYGEGARGAIMMTWPLGGGHTMNWVVENGEFKMIDAQREGADGYEAFANSKFDVEVVRLDNAELLPGSTDFVRPYKQPVDISKSVSDGAKKVKSTLNKIGKQAVSSVKSAIDSGMKAIKKLFGKG